MHGAGCRLKHGWLAARSRGPGCLVRQCPHAAQAKACGLGRALGVGRSELCRRRLLPTSAGWQPHVGPGVCGARCPGVRAGPYEFALKTRSCVIHSRLALSRLGPIKASHCNLPLPQITHSKSMSPFLCRTLPKVHRSPEPWGFNGTPGEAFIGPKREPGFPSKVKCD